MKIKIYQYFIVIWLIVLSLCIIWRVRPIVESSESFYIGTFVALMAIAVAFIVGYQIINAIHIKDKIEQLFSINDELTKRNELLKTQMSIKLKELNDDTNTLNAVIIENGYIFEALICHQGLPYGTHGFESFLKMHQAILPALEYHSKNLGFILSNLRHFFIEIETQHFFGVSHYMSDDQVLRCGDPNSPYFNKAIKDCINDLMKPLKDEELKVREHINFTRIEIEYNRVMRIFYDHIEKCAVTPCYTFPIGERQWVDK